jgi:signal transduction histidine kinase
MREGFFARRIAASFALLMLVGVIVVAIGVVMLRTTTRTSADATRRHAQDVIAVERLRYRTEHLVAVGREFILTGNPQDLARVQEVRAELLEDLDLVRDQIATPEGMRRIQQVRAATHAYETKLFTIFSQRLVVPQGVPVDLDLNEQLRPLRETLRDSLEEFVRYKEARFDESAVRTEHEIVRATWALGSAGFIAFVMSLILAGVVTRRLSALYARERQAVARAQSAASQREEILAIVSHDLRSPLSAVLLGARALERSGPGQQERIARAAESIRKAAGRMERLIRDLLDAASIEQGRLSVASAVCPVPPILQETQEAFIAVANAKGIELRTEPDSPTPHVLADHERLVQALSNLVGNALKFTPEGGRVTLKATGVGEGVLFCVRDTGPGIPRQHQARLFERYWTGRTGDRRGVGLGLYITRGIVEAHGGRIWVESAPGEGSAFYVLVPRAVPVVDSPARTAATTVSTH